MKSPFLRLIFLAADVAAGNLAAADGQPRYTAIPMAALMASPEAHDSKPVQTAGFARDTLG